MVCSNEGVNIAEEILLKEYQADIALFLADIRWNGGWYVVAATGICSLTFRFTGSIDQIAIRSSSWRNAWIIIIVVRSGRSEGECWAGNEWHSVFDWEPPGGLASFRMRATWATGGAKRAINRERKERLGKTAMSSRQID